MSYFKKLTIMLLLLSLISACSSEEPTVQQPPTPPAQTSENQTQDPPNITPSQEESATEITREEKIKKLEEMIPDYLTKRPETVQEFADLPPGRYAGIKYSEHEEEIVKLLKELPDIENPDQEIIDMYFLYLLGLFAEDYPDPQQMIDSIKLASFGSPDIGDPRFQFKETYNVEIILDASGSMANVAGGKTRMEAAKEAIKAFAESLPKEANVALRVYGHKGTGSESDKALSCGSSELVYGMQPYNAQKLQQSLDMFKPAGWTPIAHSIQEAQKDLAGRDGDKNTNIIYLVSDGIETCGGDPVEAARALAKSNISPIVNVIGFGTDGEGQRQLKEVAKAAGGRYVLIQNQKELQEEFDRAEEIAKKWYDWKVDAKYDAFSTELERALDITQFSMDWVRKSTDERYSIFSAISDLSSKDILSKKIIDGLDKLKVTHQELGAKHGHELENFLDSLNEKSYKEAIDAINKQYNSNVQSN